MNIRNIMMIIMTMLNIKEICYFSKQFYLLCLNNATIYSLQLKNIYSYMIQFVNKNNNNKVLNKSTAQF